MKRTWFVLLFGLFILAFSVPALAVIDNTHHELATYLTSGTNRFTCFACHGYPPNALAAEPTLGRVGSFCYLRCHAGTTSALGTGGAAVVPGPVATITGTPTDNGLTVATGAATGIQALSNGHGLDWGYFASGQADAASGAPAWPYNDKAGGGNMECTTCHDVHNNAYAPFLRAPLSSAATDNESHSAFTFNGSIADQANLFCQRCHTGGSNGANRYNAISAMPNGTHPVEMTTAGVPVNGGTRMTSWTAVAPFSGTRGGRTIDLKGTVFETTTIWGTGLNGAQALSWNLGGKLGGTATQVVGCYTCHAVHMNKLLAAPAGQTYANLTVMPYADNNSHLATNDDLCVGCHGNTTRLANPGTTVYYHPVSNETDNTVTGGGLGSTTASYTGSTGTIEIIVNMSGKVYGGNGTAADGRLLCTSCHAPAHAKFGGALNGSLILATNLPLGCGSCHVNNSGADFNQANSHHIYGTTTNYTTATPSWTNPAYMTGTVATLTDGLQCWDCHTNGSTTAHNWQ